MNLLITLIRSVILYFLVVLAIRLMGKRQIGELQPSELVITILISEAASIPLQENSLPLTASLIPVLTLISLEIILSVISMKSVRIRNIFSGKSVKVISDGKISQEKMKSLRFTIDDLLEALRQKDIFDISEVDTAIVETNGMLSVFKNGENQSTTAQMLGKADKSLSVPQVLIADGQIVKENIGVYGITRKDIDKKLSEASLKIQDVFLMTANKKKEFNLVKKD